MLTPFIVGSLSAFQGNLNSFPRSKCTNIIAVPTPRPFFKKSCQYRQKNKNHFSFSRNIPLHDASLFTGYNETEALPLMEQTVHIEQALLTKLQVLEEMIIENNEQPVEIEVDSRVVAQLDHVVEEPRTLKSSAPTEWWQNFDLFKDESRNDVQVARILLLVAAALYGTNFALVKILDENVPVGASTSLRFGLSALVSLPWLLPSGKELKKKGNFFELADPSLFWGSTFAGMEVGFWTSLGYVAQAVGLETIDASKSAFICSLAVVFVPLLDCLTGKKLSLKKFFGIFMAVSGVGLLELGGSLFSVETETALPALSSGDYLSFLQPIAFGIGFWRMENSAEKYPNETARLTSAQLFAVGLASFAYCFSGIGETPPNLSDFVGWITDAQILSALAWTGLVSTALTIFMETLALKTVSAAEATLILSTEPIWGSAWAALFVGEQLGIEAGLGAALILGGCLISTYEKEDDVDKDIIQM